MIDNTNNNNSNRGLATALRDRPRGIIPHQPNRLLPIRPPPNTPRRGILPRRNLSTQSFKLNASIESETNQVSPVATPDENQCEQQEQSSKSHITIEVPNWQTDVRQPYISVINICNSLDKMTNNSSKRVAPNDEENSSTSNSNLIDISHSPDRLHCSNIDSINSTSHSPRSSSEQEYYLTPKKKRRSKQKIHDETNNLEIGVDTPSKIVPPLRLKKIQSLQDEELKCPPNWGNASESEEKPEKTEGFRFYQPRSQESPINKDASKYRIVTGTTPPCDICIDSRKDQVAGKESSEQSDKKLHTQQDNVKVKLGELQCKIAELGREMLRIASTSPENPVQKAIDSYGQQIDTLTELLRSDNSSKTDADLEIDDVVPISVVVSTVSTITHALNMPILSPTSSPEPPKLSPQNLLNTSPMRITPPILKKIAIADEEETDDPLREFKDLREFVTITRKRKLRKTQVNSSSTINSTMTTTTGNSVSDLNSKTEVLDIRHDDDTALPINEHIDMCIENAKIIDVKSLTKNPQIHDNINNDPGSTPIPCELIIDTIGSLEDFVNRTDLATTAYEPITLKKNADGPEFPGNMVRTETTPITILSSSCKTTSQATNININTSNSKSIKYTSNTMNRCLDVVVTKDLPMGEQFPSLANWLTTATNRVPNDQKLPPGLSVIRTSKTPITFQGQNQVCVPGGVQITSIGVTATTLTITTASTTPTTITTMINGAPLTNSGRQWGADNRWDSQERYRHPPQEYTNTTVTIPNVQLAGQQPQQVRSNYCPPPLNVGRCYPRHFPMEPYPAAYGCNPRPIQPTICGAAVRYPPTRARGLPQGYRPRYVTPLTPYNMPQCRMPSPSYSVGTQACRESKQVTVDNQRANPQSHAIRQNMANSNASGQRIHQQNQQVSTMDEYSRIYAEQMNRVSQMQDLFREQMDNYRQSWRAGVLSSNPLPPGNYPVNTNWAADPYSLLAALSPVALQNVVPPMPVARQRSTQDLTVEQPRQCETPHLSKINYPPNSDRTLQCSNCSLPGPLFKCLGCEAAFYCDENCQARHWNRHVASCPKKMPKLRKVVP